MSNETAIEWCDSTWNPWRGCREVSPGCDHCYARTYAERFGQPWAFTRAAKATFNAPLKWHPVALDEDDPLGPSRSRRIFTCSLSDFFARDADAWRAEAWDIIRRTPQHTYLILTKRPWNIRTRLPDDWGAGWPNVWLGVTAENQQWADLRIPALLSVPSAVRFVSYEPALGPVDFRCWLQPVDAGMWMCSRCGFRLAKRLLVPGAMSVHIDADQSREVCPNDGSTLVPDRSLDWLIVGGESGPGARPFDLAWARSAVAQCREAWIPVFVKQLGAKPCEYVPFVGDLNRAALGITDPKGGDMAEWPVDLRVRQWPEAVQR